MVELISYRFGSEQNFQYILIAQGSALVVDPLDGEGLRKRLEERGGKLVAILITHAHADHWAGLTAFSELKPRVYAHPHFLKELNLPLPVAGVQEGDTIPFGNDYIQVFSAPGHHPSHLWFALYPYLFVGDTLFAMGCGNTRFGGDLEQLYRSVWGRLRWFDPSFLLLFGHDYLGANRAFARAVEPENGEIARYPFSPGTLPTAVPLGEELKVNPFLRCDQEGVREGVRRLTQNPHLPQDPRTIFQELRKLRDQFRG